MTKRNSRLLFLAIFVNLIFGNLIVFRVILQPNFPALNFSAHHILSIIMTFVPISLISIWLLINNARYFLKEQDRMKRIIRSMIIAYVIPISCFWFLIFIIVMGNSGESDKILLTAFIASGLFASIGSIFWGPFALINYLIFSKLVPPAQQNGTGIL